MTDQRGFVLPSPMMVMGGVTIAFALSTILFWNLYRGTIDDFANFKSAVAAEQATLKSEADKRYAGMVEVNSRLENGWNTALDELRKRRHVRVQPCSGAGLLPAIPIAPRKPDGSPAELRPDPSITITTEQCEDRVNKAVNDAAHVVWLHTWIKQQHEASK